MNDRVFLSPPHMGGDELDFVKQAFASNFIAPLGPMVDAFEQEFAAYSGIPHCLALNSGTAATHLALRHLIHESRIGAQNERSVHGQPVVIASTLTFIGSVTPACFEHCELRFVDADPATWNMDPSLLDEELEVCRGEGREVLAVVPTDLYGQCCDLPQIRAACDRHDVPVICDSAESMGARYVSEECGDRSTELWATGASATSPAPCPVWRHAGYDAWAAIYSFNGNKIMTTSGGGMLASHDKALIDHARKLSQQARDPAPWYEHTEIGFNYRMSNVLAAIGRGQLRVLDERVARRRAVFAAYRSLLADLPGLTFMPEADYNRATRWLSVARIDTPTFGVSPAEVRLALEAENIETRPVWKPMHMQPVFRNCRVRGGRVSEQLFQDGLCLPSGTAMTDDQIERVANIVRAAAIGHGK